MKLDPNQLRAEADAHAQRMASPLWTPLKREKDNTWYESLADSEPPRAGSAQSRVNEQPDPFLDEPEPQSQLRLEELERQVQHLTQAAGRPLAATPVDGVPGWLERAGGNPHTYDAPDGARQGVCVRILPGMYDRLRQVQLRAGLRTRAAAWEFLLRLGLAATERLPRGQPC